MRRPLLVTFSDISIIKTKNIVIIPSKTNLLVPIVNGIYSWKKKEDDILFDLLRRFHLNITLVTEVIRSKF